MRVRAGQAGQADQAGWRQACERRGQQLWQASQPGQAGQTRADGPAPECPGWPGSGPRLASAPVAAAGGGGGGGGSSSAIDFLACLGYRAARRRLAAAAVSVANLVFIHADDDELEDIKQRFFGLCLLDIGLLLKSWSYEIKNLLWPLFVIYWATTKVLVF